MLLLGLRGHIIGALKVKLASVAVVVRSRLVLTRPSKAHPTTMVSLVQYSTRHLWCSLITQITSVLLKPHHLQCPEP